MLGHLPETIEPFRLANQGETLKGQLALGRMQRLMGMVEGVEGDINVTLAFSVDDNRMRYVDEHISTALKLVCQRCMDEMVFSIDLKMQVGFVLSDEQAKHLPEEYDPLVVEDDTVVLADLVEDEIILALPLVAMHETDECNKGSSDMKNTSESEIEMEPRENPFAILKSLK